MTGCFKGFKPSMPSPIANAYTQSLKKRKTKSVKTCKYTKVHTISSGRWQQQHSLYTGVTSYDIHVGVPRLRGAGLRFLMMLNACVVYGFSWW